MERTRRRMLEVVDSHIRSWNGDQAIPGSSKSKAEKYSEMFDAQNPGKQSLACQGLLRYSNRVESTSWRVRRRIHQFSGQFHDRNHAKLLDPKFAPKGQPDRDRTPMLFYQVPPRIAGASLMLRIHFSLFETVKQYAMYSILVGLNQSAEAYFIFQ